MLQTLLVEEQRLEGDGGRLLRLRVAVGAAAGSHGGELLQSRQVGGGVGSTRRRDAAGRSRRLSESV